MWRSCGRRVVKDLVHHGGRRPRSPNPCAVLGLRRFGNDEQCGVLDSGWNFQRRAGFAAAGGGSDGEGEKMSKGVGGGGLPISFGEAKRLMRLVNVEALKTKLGTEGKEAIPYNDLLEACQSIGVARSKEEAAAFARVLDEAGVILLFRDKVLLHPDRHQEVSPTLTLKAARNLAYEFLHAAGPLCRKRFINRNMQWLPPPSGLFKINTDASWYPPNQAGIGAVIRDSNRVLIAGTEAEASAILAGADLAASLQLQDVIIESDSEEVILEL